jgi:hypothetical protein
MEGIPFLFEVLGKSAVLVLQGLLDARIEPVKAGIDLGQAVEESLLGLAAPLRHALWLMAKEPDGGTRRTVRLSVDANHDGVTSASLLLR